MLISAYVINIKLPRTSPPGSREPYLHSQENIVTILFMVLC